MALPAAVEWEIRTTGAASNGGGFVRGGTGTDWSQQDTPQYAVTDAVSNGTTTVTSATAAFGTDVVDNILYFVGGSGGVGQGWYRIVSRTNSTTIVVDRAITASTGATLNIGGALNAIATLNGVGEAGNVYHIKSGTYPQHIGSVQIKGGATGTRTTIVGYGTTRWDDAARPVLQPASGTACLTITTTAAGERAAVFRSLDFNGGGVGTTAIAHSTSSSSQPWVYALCTFRNFTGNGLTTVISSAVIGCHIHSNGGNGLENGSGAIDVAACLITDNAGYGILGGNTILAARNTIVARNGSAGIRARAFNLVSCVLYDNTGDGVEIDSSAAVVTDAIYAIINCVAWSNDQGFDLGGATPQAIYSRIGLVRNNAVGGNSGTDWGGSFTAHIGTVTLTADPFTNAAADDFSLNATAGGGAALAGAGWPTAYPVP